MQKISLIIERGEDSKLWGRVNFDDNLLTDYANNIPALERKMKKLLKDFHEVSNVEFEHLYDVSVFFENFNFLKQTKIAELAGINSSLLRQYASGIKHPSPEQAKKIEVAIHQLAKDMEAVSLYAE